MRTVVSHLVAVALTLHTLLGCCWHHAHESDANVAQVEIESTASAHGCCHSHRAHDLVEHDEDQSIPSDPVDHSPDACGETCQYVSVSRVQVDSLVDLAVLDFLPAESSVASAIGNSVLRFGTSDAAVYPPPLRLHLLHLLLLI